MANLLCCWCEGGSSPPLLLLVKVASASHAWWVGVVYMWTHIHIHTPGDPVLNLVLLGFSFLWQLTLHLCLGSPLFHEATAQILFPRGSLNRHFFPPLGSDLNLAIWGPFTQVDLYNLGATSNTRLRARDHYTSSTLVGGQGGAAPSSLLHAMRKGPMEGVCECKMGVFSLHGFLRGIQWIVVHGHLDYFQKPTFWR